MLDVLLKEFELGEVATDVASPTLSCLEPLIGGLSGPSRR